MWYITDINIHNAEASAAEKPSEGFGERRRRKRQSVPNGELERLWKQGKIDLGTMVWRHGMSDWMALGDVPELAYIREFARVGVGSGCTTAGDAVLLRPGKVSSLRRLADRDLIPKLPKRAKSAADIPAGMDVPLLARLVQATSEPSIDFSPGLPAPMPMKNQLAGSKGGAWFARPKFVAAATIAVVLGVVSGAAVSMYAVQRSTVIEVPVDSVAEDRSSDNSLVNSSATASLVDDVLPLEPIVDHTSGASSVEAAASLHPIPKRAPAPVTIRPPSRKEGATTDGGGGAPSAVGEQARFVEMSKGVIVAGVRSNGATVVSCIKAAVRSGELRAGVHNFTLDWTIRPDGSIADPALVGPARVLHGTLPLCFAREMASWQFPPSGRTTPVRNFPFGPITLR